MAVIHRKAQPDGGRARPHERGAAPTSLYDRLLAVQRRAGNTAVCALIEGHASPAVQRSIGVSVAELSKLRTGNKLQRALASSTFDKLVAVRVRYDKAKDPLDRLLFADALAGLSDRWLAAHGNTKSQADLKRRPVVEDLQAHALRAASKIRAERIYMKEMEGGGLKGVGATTKLNAVGQAKGLAQGKTSPSAGAGDAAAALAAEHKLTAAEIAAIRVYTLPDYTYLNPAVANSDGWMESRLAEAKDLHAFKKVDAKVLKGEGALHAGMMMQGLSKLPPWKGLTYRGMRMSPEKFADDYYKGATIVNAAFTSSAKIESAARKFADGVGGDTPPAPAQTVSVLCKINLTNGRDIATLSAAAVKEDEVLVLPSAELRVDSIELHATGSRGSTHVPATSWATVHMTQLS